MATLHFQQIAKTYPNGTPVVRGLSLEIPDGEFMVIVGPSGCGKSTLLRMVAGLEPITSGEIRIDDKVINKLEPAERDIAMVFQNYALYPHMTVYDNMAYSLRIRKMSKQQIDTTVRAAAQTLGLEKLLERKPGELSGGQRQRVAMGRAIVRQPKVFLFDEPLSNLDAKLRVQMRLELQTLHQRLRTTSLYVTHDQIEAMTLADRMIVMNAGAAEQIGTPQEVFDEPASIFVASFIGSPPMNLIDVEIDATGNNVRTTDGSVITLPAPAPASIRGGRATLGLRPEHLLAGSAGLDLVVGMVEILGSEQLVHGRIGKQPCILRCSTASLARPAPGSQISVGIHDASRVHWFSAETGRRVANI
ncbi:sn-glycerol-3-phosphate import ATP-binding protein UgpC [Pigmentiphaga aceris]|uniref:sn-glycerol-3-phosphate import ATP-binding protein UgpC n=1 Tax=Pigmentiphaga aceris TaxID=1940612 RepID=A0A5C0AT12_9BURK|nr:sn-glycerol-3-phosphate import ATP-binding protein UgpC [Pigmentiphaga aceris]QEI05398.1 sn-glycerol-3-phosphate import ATP-binding protein UgpC [Pigmentiphaga aceris]